MNDYIFVFDLDSTITKEEILPRVAREIGKEEEMRNLTEIAMKKNVDFKSNFLPRVSLLLGIPVNKVSSIISKIPLHNNLVSFIKKNIERCFVVTGNLDVWIEELIKFIGIENHVFCSKTICKNNYITEVNQIIEKEKVVLDLKNKYNKKICVVGDGSNDAGMVALGDIGIGFGGVRDVAPNLKDVSTHLIYNEDTLVNFLTTLSED